MYTLASTSETEPHDLYNDPESTIEDPSNPDRSRLSRMFDWTRRNGTSSTTAATHEGPPPAPVFTKSAFSRVFSNIPSRWRDNQWWRGQTRRQRIRMAVFLGTLALVLIFMMLPAYRQFMQNPDGVEESESETTLRDRWQDVMSIYVGPDKACVQIAIRQMKMVLFHAFYRNNNKKRQHFTLLFTDAFPFGIGVLSPLVFQVSAKYPDAPQFLLVPAGAIADDYFHHQLSRLLGRQKIILTADDGPELYEVLASNADYNVTYLEEQPHDSPVSTTHISNNSN